MSIDSSLPISPSYPTEIPTSESCSSDQTAIYQSIDKLDIRCKMLLILNNSIITKTLTAISYLEKARSLMNTFDNVNTEPRKNKVRSGIAKVETQMNSKKAVTTAKSIIYPVKKVKTLTEIDFEEALKEVENIKDPETKVKALSYLAKKNPHYIQQMEEETKKITNEWSFGNRSERRIAKNLVLKIKAYHDFKQAKEDIEKITKTHKKAQARILISKYDPDIDFEELKKLACSEYYEKITTYLGSYFSCRDNASLGEIKKLYTEILCKEVQSKFKELNDLPTVKKFVNHAFGKRHGLNLVSIDQVVTTWVIHMIKEEALRNPEKAQKFYEICNTKRLFSGLYTGICFDHFFVKGVAKTDIAKAKVMADSITDVYEKALAYVNLAEANLEAR